LIPFFSTIDGALKMADIIDSCYINVQMIKADKNNNTTAKIDDEDLPNGNNDKSENVNSGDTDEQCLSSFEISPNIESSSDKTNSYKDFSGIDTESFISTTLRNNPKDRTLLLTLEKVFQEFIQNEEQTSHQFQAMNSCKNQPTNYFP
jgi:hypothetical protein